MTSETGAILDLRTVAVQDATGGILVLLPSRDAPILARGDVVAVAGKLASRSGALEITVSSNTGVRISGTAEVPAARRVTSADLGEDVEGLLVAAAGTVTRVTRATSGSATLVLEDARGTLTVSCWQPCAGDARKGSSVQVTGIAGQRWTRSGAADGYRIWPRTPSDVVVAEGQASPSPTPSATASASPAPSPSEIASVRARSGVEATIEGVVTTVPGFIDADARRVVLQDASGALLVRLPAGASVAVGDVVRATGRVGTLSGAPQLSATAASVTGHASAAPVALTHAPAAADEWRLVRVAGLVQTVRRYGTTWRAEVRLSGGAIVVIQGTSRSGIASTTLVEGRDATLVGIVRRPASSAADQRFAILPRSPSDVSVGPRGAAVSSGPAAGGATAGRGATGGATTSAGTGSGRGTGTGAGAGPGAARGTVLDVDLADTASHLGELVRVGGTVQARTSAGIVLDDGTGTADVRFSGDATALLGAIEVDDVINVTGFVQRVSGSTPSVVVREASDIARVGNLGETVPIVAASAAPATATTGDQALRQVAQMRLGPVAIPLPGLPGWAIAALALLVLGAVAAVSIAARRFLAERRERASDGIVDRLGQLLAAPVNERRS